jgi:putrescine aminotransferase
VSLTPPQFNRVFFTGSGSEANDTVVRMVRRYWDLRGQPDRQVIISRINAYHGSTMAGASLGGMAFMHAQGGLPIPNIVHIAQPYWYAEGGDESPEVFGLRIARTLEEKIREIGKDKVAAFIGGPLQGAGGVIIPPSTYWPEIQRICDEYGILLVADEVICGFGRTGRWFGSEYFGIRPDLMPIAKGLSSGYLPIGGVMVGDRVAEVLIDKAASSPMAHPFGASGGVRRRQRQPADDRAGGSRRSRAPDAGPYPQKKRELAGHPLVGVARLGGPVGAIELVREQGRTAVLRQARDVGTICRDHCFGNGLTGRGARHHDRLAAADHHPEQIDELAEKAHAA